MPGQLSAGLIFKDRGLTILDGGYGILFGSIAALDQDISGIGHSVNGIKFANHIPVEPQIFEWRASNHRTTKGVKQGVGRKQKGVNAQTTDPLMRQSPEISRIGQLSAD